MRGYDKRFTDKLCTRRHGGRWQGTYNTHKTMIYFITFESVLLFDTVMYFEWVKSISVQNVTH